MNNKKFSLLMVLLLLLTTVFPLANPLNVFAESQNLALGKPAFSSGNEVDFLGPEKATDGDKTNRSRWSSAKEDDQWFYVDLGEKKKIGQVVIRWNTAAETYKILVSNDKEHWTNVMENDATLTGGSTEQNAVDTINFSQLDARYVKFQGIKRRPSMADGNLYGYSFYEFEVYEEEDPRIKIIEDIEENLIIQKGQTEITLPEIPDGYKATLIGSDRSQVIDEKGNIHAPLVDVKVNLLIQVEDEHNPEREVISDNVLVTVPGQNTQTDDLNKEPKVIPSLQEWYGSMGDFTLTGSSRIVVNPEDKVILQKSAEATKSDLKDITKLDLNIDYGSPKSGDIYLSIDGSLTTLGEEGYIFDVNDYLSITSVDVKGVFYGTRTVLQILKQNKSNNNIPKGISRDYPKYEERGFMLDVARKFYNIEFLRNYVKLMSYYKMNTFQIHLNDDVGTPFADGTTEAFRLESETYPGLASESGHYTKDEFRDLQQLGMDYGVNVIPEIDTPGHSSVFVKYDPSLGKDRELDITRSETVDFVKGLFDEYIDGDNPTFIGPDVHIGTDEYWSGTTEVFREYMDTLINHINSKGKNTHLWGGLTIYDGETPISNDATMDIWHKPYGEAQQAIDLGYEIVNIDYVKLYIVPRIYRDYLDNRSLYNNWEPNIWSDGMSIPLGVPNLKGAKFALWNDISVAEGVSMADSHIRILPSIQVLSEKLWAGNKEGQDYNKFLETASQV